MIYTKKGDRGRTSLLKNNKLGCLSKDSPVIRVIGALDEANSYLGIITSKTRKPNIRVQIENVQKDLMLIASLLAGAKVKLPEKRTLQLEKKINSLEKRLPVLKHFLLPGGSTLAAHLMYARTLVRRAESELVGSKRKKTKIPTLVYIYLNRLSDYLFMLSREENCKSNKKERFWLTDKGNWGSKD